jgi:hypothetical protein
VSRVHWLQWEGVRCDDPKRGTHDARISHAKSSQVKSIYMTTGHGSDGADAYS